MKSSILKALKIMLYGFIAVVVIGGGTVFVMAKSSAQPASMNMGQMDGMVMEQGSHTMIHDKVDEIPIATLIEKPSDAPVKTFNLTAEEKEVDMGGGKLVKALTYNGTAPGPEIRVQQGDRVVVHLTNHLKEGVTIHWHGVELPNAEDGVAGVTQDKVPQNGEFTYDFVAKQSGTYWYHSHQESDKETTKGLFGALVVEPKQSSVHYDHDYTALLHDWANNINTVNGTSEGERFEAKPGDLVRLRLINTSSITHMMTLIGAPFKVIAIDAHDIQGPTELSEVILPVAASLRYDLEFKMPEQGAVKLVNTDQTGFTGNFFTKLLGFSAPSAESAHLMFTASFGTGESPSTALTQLQNNPQFDFASYGSPIIEQDNLTLDATFTRQFEMELGNALGFFNSGFTMKFQINQKAFPDIPTYMVKAGDLVKINIINNSDISHPMHIHGHAMKILAKNGKPLTGSPVFLSTLLVGSHESYEVGFVANNPGLWMIHCHNLGHAANGMDMMLNYEGVTTTYAVGNKTGNHPD